MSGLSRTRNPVEKSRQQTRSGFEETAFCLLPAAYFCYDSLLINPKIGKYIAMTMPPTMPPSTAIIDADSNTPCSSARRTIDERAKLTSATARFAQGSSDSV